MNTLDRPRISAANIVIKKPAGTDPIIERLKRLHATCTAGGNKNDSVITLITACLEEEINTRPHIVDTLGQLGYNPQHVALMLKHNTGPNPASKHWWLDPDGRYHQHS